MGIDTAHRHHERGMTTAEYGVGILCASAIAGGLLALVDAQWYAEFLTRAFDVSFTRTLADLVGSLW
jgi:hypothetical protein